MTSLTNTNTNKDDGAPEEAMARIKGVHTYNGFLCMPDSTTDIMDWACKEFEFKDGDVLIASYPLQGITWLQEALWLMHRPDRIGVTGERKTALGCRVPMFEHAHYDIPPWDIIANTIGARLFKCHLPYELVARHLNAGKVRLIVWVMDPRATLVQYHRFWNRCGKRYGWPQFSWDEFFELFRAGRLLEGDWFDMTLGYLPQINHDRVHYMRFEDVKSKPMEAVRDLADFCHLSLSPEQLAAVSTVVPFDKSADWRDVFTADQLDYYNQVYKTKMAGTILQDVYVD